MDVIENKRDQITEAAIKRFSHFGISKTTMNEIADDLAMSKTLLYHYFPDKISLIVEVVNYIFSEYISIMTKRLEESKNILEGLNNIVDIRTELGQKYFMMHVGDGQAEINLSDPRINSVLAPYKQEEQKLISNFLLSGINNNELKDFDYLSTSDLLVDIITGVWISELHIKCKVIIPAQEQFDLIKEKNKKIIQMIYDGIKTI